MQPLFYSQNFPKSLNYGGIGVVIGHGKLFFSFINRNCYKNFLKKTEITHGFDDKGRQFDLVGNMKQWWNNATIRNFRERAQCIIDQYSRYRIDEVGLFMNGRMTQGENIAVSFKLAFGEALDEIYVFEAFKVLSKALKFNKILLQFSNKLSLPHCVSILIG